MRAITDPNYDLVGTLGDVHGDTEWTLKAIDRFAALDMTHILQMGDFGVWPDAAGEKFLQKTNARLKHHSMLMVVTLGNHEDYTRLEAKLGPARYDGEFQQLPNYDHILFAHRGQRWEWKGVRFCSLGGANSIDRFDRVPFVSWWPQESISMGDVYRTVDGGRADIMLTHECPDGVPILDAMDHHSEGAGWSAEALEYAAESSLMLRYAVDAVQPELLIHGHYHIFAEIRAELSSPEGDYSLRSVCLDKEWTDGSMAILEPTTRRLTVYGEWIAGKS